MSDGCLRALVVEDAAEFTAMLVPLLERDGFAVATAEDGEEAVALARSTRPDVVILDLNLPRLDGTEVCRQIRTFSNAYVLMLTGRAEEVDVLVGLGVGADDYMTKPFSPREFQARVRTLLRRPRPPETTAPATRQLGNLEIDPVGRDVRVAGRHVELTKVEFDLLDALVASPGVTFTRALLTERVWGANWYGDEHLVDVHIANLRRKLGDDARVPRYVRTVRGVGYRAGSG